MSLFSRIKNLLAGRAYDEDDYDYEYDDDRDYFEDGYMHEDIPEVRTTRSEVDMSSRHLRQRYVKNLCDLMQECTEEIDTASKEYKYVTDYLRDCEIIEGIPQGPDNRLAAAASNVIHLMKKNEKHNGRLGRISEAKYNHMSSIAPNMPKALNDLKEHEEYKELVRDDLKTLEGEKAVRQFKRSDAHMKQVSCKNVVIITIFAMVFVMLVLLLMQILFAMNVIPGFIMAAALGSITIAVSFSTFVNARSEERRMRNQLNQIIGKQNTVKIRFVNIQTLLTYEYEKYHVNTSEELEYNWNLYLKERKERELLRRMSTDLAAAEERFRLELMNANVNYPMLWLHQPEAVVDHREMVEIRHELVARRQGLRKRIAYNNENREAAKNEVRDLVTKYPNYAVEILDIVESYER